MNNVRVRPVMIYPAEIVLGAILFCVAVTFTIFPAVLEHSPTGFETRGLIHHLWHYVLLSSSGLVLVAHYYHGRFGAYAPRLRLLGLIGLMAALIVNLAAVIVADFQSPPIEAGGIDIGLRVAAIIFLIVRVQAIVRPPRISIEASPGAPPSAGAAVALQILTERNRDERSVLRRLARRNEERKP